MDNRSRVAIVRVGDALPMDAAPDVKIKYQFGDHLGSSNVVVDDSGSWLNREEYLPYGETSFGSFARKRYRFNGKERDEESGLCYHGARYYAPYLARWTSDDPEGLVDGVNLYCYCRNNPLRFTDPLGQMSQEQSEQYVAQMKQRGLQLPSEQPGSWAPILTNGPSSLAIDPTKGEPYERVMTAKWTLKVAQGVSMGVLVVAGGEIAPVAAVLAKAPAWVQAGVGLFGSLLGGIAFGESLTGTTITGRQLEVNQRIMQFIVGSAGLVGLLYTKLSIGEPIPLEQMNRAQRFEGNRAIGRIKEGFPLVQRLEKEGFKILAKQVRVSAGGNPRQIDILAEKNGQLFNVESKAGGATRRISQQVADEHMAGEGATFGKRSMNAPSELRGKTVQIKTIVR
jgi:RHS repeat-associated protein